MPVVLPKEFFRRSALNFWFTFASTSWSIFSGVMDVSASMAKCTVLAILCVSASIASALIVATIFFSMMCWSWCFSVTRNVVSMISVKSLVVPAMYLMLFLLL